MSMSSKDTLSTAASKLGSTRVLLLLGMVALLTLATEPVSACQFIVPAPFGNVCL